MSYVMEVSTRQRGGRQADDAFAHALQSAMFSSAVAPRPKSTSEAMEEIGGSLFAEVIEDELWGTVILALTSLEGDDEGQRKEESSPTYMEIRTIHEEEEGDGFSDDGGGDAEGPLAPSSSPPPPPPKREEKAPPPPEPQQEQPRRRRVRPQVAEIEDPPPRSTEIGYFDDQTRSATTRKAVLPPEMRLVSSETFEDDFDEEGEEDDEFVDEVFHHTVEEKRNPLDLVADAARERLDLERSLLFSTPKKGLQQSTKKPLEAKNLFAAEAMRTRRPPSYPERRQDDEVDDDDDPLSDEEDEDYGEDQLFALVRVVRVDNTNATSVEMAAKALAELRPGARGGDESIAAQLAPKALRQSAASKHMERWLDNRADGRTTHSLGLVATELFRHKMLGLCLSDENDVDDFNTSSFFPQKRRAARRSEYDVIQESSPEWTEDDAVRFVDAHGAHLGLDSAAAVALRLEMPQLLARVLLRASAVVEVGAIDAIFREGLGRTRNVETRRAKAVSGLLQPRSPLEPVAGPGARAPLCALLLRAHRISLFVEKSHENVVPQLFADLAADVLETPVPIDDDHHEERHLSTTDSSGELRLLLPPPPPWDSKFAAWFGLHQRGLTDDGKS